MNIAITGASGFIGNQVAKYYLDSGHNVYTISKDFENNMPNGINVTYGDINTLDDVSYFVMKSSPEIFIHLAAQTQANHSVKYPYNTFKTNVIGTLNILEALRDYGQSKSIIVASSDKAYGELEGEEYFEDTPLNGIYPYDASKSMLEYLCRSYRKTYMMPIATVRSCNVYGIGDNNKLRIIPGIINSYLNNKYFLIRNGGQDVRDYIHVEDVVSAYKSISEYIEMGGQEYVFNLSSDDRYSTLKLFDLVNNHLGLKVKYKIITETGSELKNQKVNSSKLRKETGWAPKYKLEESLPEIINWYLSK